MTINVDRQAIYEKVKALPPNIVVIECEWDGGSNGWFVRLQAYEEIAPNPFKWHLLAKIGHGKGELYDFNRAIVGEAPPYPEGRLAKEIGQEIAGQLGVPFYFPLPDEPTLDEVPRWIDWQAGRISSLPIRLIEPQSIMEHFRNQKVAVVEAYWGMYYSRFYPNLSVVTIEAIGDNNPQYKAHMVGALYWDDEDTGRIIHGKQIPPRTPVEEAIRLGNVLAEHFKVSFYFQSPDNPAHHLPRWIDLQKNSS